MKAGASSGGFSDKVVEIRIDDSTAPLVEAHRVLNKVRSGQMITQANQKMQAGDVKGALQLFTGACDKSPENDNAWVALAGGYLRNNQKGEALSALRKAVELNANNKARIAANENFRSIFQDPEFQKIVGR